MPADRNGFPVGPLNCHCTIFVIVCAHAFCGCSPKSIRDKGWNEPKTHVLSSDIVKGKKGPDGMKKEFILTSQ